MKPKGKGKGKGKSKASAKAATSLLPPKPAGFPKRPMDAMKTFCEEMAGKGKSLVELAKLFQDLPEEDKAARKKAAVEAGLKYQEEVAAWKRTPEGRKYCKEVVLVRKRKMLKEAKSQFLTQEPKRPPTAYFIFLQEEGRAVVQRDHPELKGVGPQTQKMGELWKELSTEQKQKWEAKAKELHEAYEKAMQEFRQSSEYKKYETVEKKASKLTSGPATAKGKGKGKGGKGKAKAKGKAKVAQPEKPSNLPTRPAGAFRLFMVSQKTSGATLVKLSEDWRNLGAEGQQKWNQLEAEKKKEYEQAMMEFKKSAEGKKYLRLKEDADKKTKLLQAKEKFLGSSEAPQEPKRPPSAYFLFVAEKRPTLSGLNMSDTAKKINELWSALTPEEKKEYEDKAADRKAKYEKDLAEYKNSASFKKYEKVVKAVTKPNKRPAPKAAAPKAAGRGGGRGRGRGAVAAPAPTAAVAAAAQAALQEDSDVMGSDSSDSSSDDSDSD